MVINTVALGLLLLFSVVGIITTLAFLFSVFYERKFKQEENFYSAARKIRDDLRKNMKYK